MVDHLNVSYLYKKRGVFYFTKRVPCDVKSYYRNQCASAICIRLPVKTSGIYAPINLERRQMINTEITDYLKL